MGELSLQQRGQMAQQLAGQGRLDEALAVVDAAPVLDQAGLSGLRVSLLKALQRLDEVVEIRRLQLAQNPSSVINQHNMASAYGGVGMHDDAIRHAREAIALGGNAAETWLVLARSLQAKYLIDEAVEAYRQVLGRRSDYVEAVSELAQIIWMAGGEIAEARRIHEEALDQNPSHAGLLHGLAVFNEYAGMDPRETYADLSNRAKRSLVNPAAYELAACHVALKFDPQLALRHAERAVDMAQNEIPAWIMLVRSLLINGRPDEALGILPQLLAAKPMDQTLLAYNATVVRMLGKPDPYGLDQPEGIIGAHRITTPQGWASLEAYLADLKIALEKQHSYDRHPIGQSLRHGTQTPIDLCRVDDPVIQALFSALDAPIRAYLAELGTGSDPVRSRNTGNYRFVGCWSVRLASGGFHESHIHPQGWLSSACYIDLPSAVERGGNEGWIGFGVPPFNLSKPLEHLKLEKPEPGKLVLFPSCMWHGTIPFEDERPRLTVAFDLLPA